MRTARILVLLTALVILGGVTPARASVFLAPSKVERRVSPGSVATVTISFVNKDPGPLDVTVAPWDFARDASGVAQPITQREAAEFRGCASWISTGGAPLTAAPGKTVAFDLTVKVPSSATWGSHSTYLRVTATPIGKRQGIAVIYALDALLVFTVAPPGSTAAEIANSPTMKRSVSIAQVSAPAFTMGGPIPLAAVLVSTGNVHADVSTRFDILQGGKVVKSIPLKDFTLLPGDRYPIRTEWTKPPLIGNYEVRFVAAVTGDRRLDKQATIWVVSWTAIVLAFTLALVLAVLVLMFRRYVHIEFRRAGAQPATE